MKKLIVGFGVVGLMVPLVSSAAYLNAGKAVNMSGSQQINDTAYVAGATVTVAAPVSGDLLAAGGSVFISSKVSGNIMAGAATLMLVGSSAHDVRIAGGNVTVGGTVSGDLLGAGSQFTVTPDAKIAKDAYIAGASVIMNGDVAGNAKIYGSSVIIGGTVEKNLTITAKSVTIASGAVIKGNLDYTAPVAATIDSGAHIAGTTNFHQSAVPAPQANPGEWLGPFAALVTFWFIAKFLMCLLLAYVLWYAFRHDAVAILEEAKAHFWKSLLRGFIFLIALPIASIIALFTVVGATLALLALFVYVALLILSSAAVVLTASSLIMKWRMDLKWYHILLGAAVLEVVGLIPFIGWIACFIVWLSAFGATLLVVGRKFAR